MITPNPKAHMSPKDLTRAIALETQTVPGWGLNDKAFHASFAANREACSGQVFSDTKIGCSSAIFRSKPLGDR